MSADNEELPHSLLSKHREVRGNTVHTHTHARTHTHTRSAAHPFNDIQTSESDLNSTKSELINQLNKSQLYHLHL